MVQVGKYHHWVTERGFMVSWQVQAVVLFAEHAFGVNSAGL